MAGVNLTVDVNKKLMHGKRKKILHLYERTVLLSGQRDRHLFLMCCVGTARVHYSLIRWPLSSQMTTKAVVAEWVDISVVQFNKPWNANFSLACSAFDFGDTGTLNERLVFRGSSWGLCGSWIFVWLAVRKRVGALHLGSGCRMGADCEKGKYR
jgi:hypothetical protein